MGSMIRPAARSETSSIDCALLPRRVRGSADVRLAMLVTHCHGDQPGRLPVVPMSGNPIMQRALN
jgi:hypothetical protein